MCCPCNFCDGGKLFPAKVVKNHLMQHGIDESYKKWVWHGEDSSNEVSNDERNSETVEMDVNIGMEQNVEVGDDIGIGESDDDEFSEDSNDFLRFVEDGDKPLYPGCKRFTKLNGLVKTYNLKTKHGLTDACYSDMLIMLGLLLPKGNEIPRSFYEAKKTFCALGIDYEKIHACPNDCILYRESNVDTTSCPACGISRWKLGKNKIEKVGVPGKVLWYFPPYNAGLVSFPLTCLITCINHLITNSALLELTYNLVSLFF